MDFKTLILRFRDLDIAENETIKRHQSIIDEKIMFGGLGGKRQ